MVHRPAARLGIALLALVTFAGSVQATSVTRGLDADSPGSTQESTDPTASRAGGGPPLMPGWPQVMGQTVPFSPVGVLLADLDRNGTREVIAGSTDNLLRVWDAAGNLLPGWPVNVGGQIQSKAAAGDLDDDGDFEIVVAVKSGEVRAYHHDGTAVSGWPQTSGLVFGFLSPVLYDLDGDEIPEVLVGGGTNQNVHAWHGDGTVVTGFPVSLGATIVATLAVGDVAGDTAPEIVALAGGNVHVLANDGTAVTGFPVSYGLSGSYAAPSIGDVDGAGGREILVVGYDFGAGFTRIFVYDGSGASVAGFPVEYASLQTYSCPVIGDVDDDGDLELFNAGKLDNPAFYAWDHTGTPLPGWPVDTDPNMEGSAVVAQLDGDAELEIVIGDNANVVYGFNPDGDTGVTGFPFNSFGSSLPDAPSLADVDMDGDLDLALTAATGQVAIWDLDVPWDPAAVEWGELFHDRYNTNQHGFVPPEPVVIAVAEPTPPAFALGVVRPNPSGAAFRVSLELGRESRVTAHVFDAAGRSVRELIDTAVSAGAHALSWDGRGANGRETPAGVYFLRVSVEGESLTRRIVRL